MVTQEAGTIQKVQEPHTTLSPQEYLTNVQQYLNWFGITLHTHHLEKWQGLPESIESPALTIAVGLTHECLTDGLYMRVVLERLRNNHDLQYHGVVFAEGLLNKNGQPNLRKKLADRIVSPLLFHKNNPQRSDIRNIANKSGENSSTVVFPQGTRVPTARLNDTIRPVAAAAGRTKSINIFPFLSLGLEGGIFPAGSQKLENILAIVFKGGLFKKHRDVHFIAGEPMYADETRKLLNEKSPIDQTESHLLYELELRRLKLLQEFFKVDVRNAKKYPMLLEEVRQFEKTGKPLNKRLQST